MGGRGVTTTLGELEPCLTGHPLPLSSSPIALLSPTKSLHRLSGLCDPRESYELPADLLWPRSPAPSHLHIQGQAAAASQPAPSGWRQRQQVCRRRRRSLRPCKAGNDELPLTRTPVPCPACSSGSRRALLTGAGGGLALAGGLLAAGGVVAMAAAAAGGDPNQLTRSGMRKFEQNDVEGSVADFNAALAARPAIRPYLWQRGLSLYYLGEFAEAAQQVRGAVGGRCWRRRSQGCIRCCALSGSI